MYTVYAHCARDSKLSIPKRVKNAVIVSSFYRIKKNTFQAESLLIYQSINIQFVNATC